MSSTGSMERGKGGGCLENFSRGSRGHRFKVYPIAEPLTPLGQPIDRIMPPPFVEVVRAQLVIRFLAREHVQDTDHDGVGHCHDRTVLPPTRRQASIHGRQRGQRAPFPTPRASRVSWGFRQRQGGKRGASAHESPEKGMWDSIRRQCIIPCSRYGRMGPHPVKSARFFAKD